MLSDQYRIRFSFIFITFIYFFSPYFVGLSFKDVMLLYFCSRVFLKCKMVSHIHTHMLIKMHKPSRGRVLCTSGMDAGGSMLLELNCRENCSLGGGNSAISLGYAS